MSMVHWSCWRRMSRQWAVLKFAVSGGVVDNRRGWKGHESRGDEGCWDKEKGNGARTDVEPEDGVIVCECALAAGVVVVVVVVEGLAQEILFGVRDARSIMRGDSGN